MALSADNELERCHGGSRGFIIFYNIWSRTRPSRPYIRFGLENANESFKRCFRDDMFIVVMELP